MSTTGSTVRPRARRLHPHRAFWIISATVVMVLFASAAPSPLYPVYQDLWGFSAFTLTVVFAVYVVTMLISLLTVGSLSDHIGRRPVLAVALALLIVSMILFLTAGDVPALIAARALQGLATGAALGTLTATVVDMAPTPRLGSAITGAAPSLGLAAGVAITGALIQYAPGPRFLIYLLILGAFAVLLIALMIVPETAEPAGFSSRRHLATTLSPQASIPAAVRPVFGAAVPALVATWSLGGLYLSLGSSIVDDVFGVTNHAAAGLLLFVFFGSTSVMSLILASATPSRKLVIGYPLLSVGALVSVVGVFTGVLPIYLTGSIVAGAGFAGVFLGALDNLSAATPPTQRGQVFSAVFVTSYLAFSVPAVIAGTVVAHAGLRATVVGYVGYVVILAIIGTALTLRGRTRIRPAPEITPDTTAHEITDENSGAPAVSQICMSAPSREE